MRVEKKIRIAFYLLAAGGAALFTLLLIRQGAPHVIAAFASAGWWIAAVGIITSLSRCFLDVLPWWALFPKSSGCRCGIVLDALDRRIGQHARAFRTVGGDVVRARLAALHGAPIRLQRRAFLSTSRWAFRPDCFYAVGLA